MPDYEDAANNVTRLEGGARIPTLRQAIDAHAKRAAREWAEQGITKANASVHIGQLQDTLKEEYREREGYTASMIPNITYLKNLLTERVNEITREQRQAEIIAGSRNVVGFEEIAFDRIEQVNERFVVVTVGGSVRVYDLQARVFMSFKDFSGLLLNIPAPDETNGGFGAYWLRSTGRPTYPNGMDIYAGNEVAPNGVLNLWRGWGCETKKGKWTKFQEHLKEHVCQGDKEKYEYLIKWMAWVLQNPNKRAETVVVLKGLQGTGKGLIDAVMAHIFSDEHSFKASSSGSVTGDFNGWMRHTLWLFVDEAFFAGDPRIRGRLKSLITEGRVSVNQKGIDEKMIINRMSIMMASNEEWVVHVTVDDRRFYLLEVDENVANDKKHFDPIWKEMFEKGGVEAFFHDMLKMDLKNWHPRNMPTTMSKDKARQIGMSMEPEKEWILGILRDTPYSFVNGAEHASHWVQDNHGNVDPEATWIKGDITLRNQLLTDHLSKWLKDRNMTISGNRAMKLAHLMKKIGATKATRQGSNGDRGWIVPSLKTARNTAAQSFFKMDWIDMMQVLDDQ